MSSMDMFVPSFLNLENISQNTFMPFEETNSCLIARNYIHLHFFQERHLVEAVNSNDIVLLFIFICLGLSLD